MNKFIVNYTEKTEESGTFTGFHSMEGFSTRKQAEEWVETQANIYWNEIVELDAASQKPKVVVAGEFGPEWEAHPGTLQTYHETGMECLGLTLYKDGIVGEPNPNFDPSKKEDGRNFRNYKTWEALKFIKKDTVLEIDGVRYAMIKDREFAKADAYRLSFYPVGFSTEELLQLFLPENKRAILYERRKKS